MDDNGYRRHVEDPAEFEHDWSRVNIVDQVPGQQTSHQRPVDSENPQFRDPEEPAGTGGSTGNPGNSNPGNTGSTRTPRQPGSVSVGAYTPPPPPPPPPPTPQIAATQYNLPNAPGKFSVTDVSKTSLGAGFNPSAPTQRSGPALSTAERVRNYTQTGGPGGGAPAPVYGGTAGPASTGGPRGYQQTGAPGAAPNFMEISEIGGPVQGPSYGTAGGAFADAGFVEALQQRAAEMLRNPSRYSADLVKQGLDVSESYLEKEAQDAERGLDEKMARRGILGSTIEWRDNATLAADFQRQRNERAFNLNREQANTWANDVATAGNFGLGVGSLARNLGDARMAEGRYGWESNRQTARDLEDDKRARAGLRQVGGQLTEDSTRYRSDFGQRENQYGWRADFERNRASEDDSRFRSEFRQRDNTLRSDSAFKANRAGEDDRRFRSEFARDENRFGWEANRTANRDNEQDARYRYESGEDRYRFDTDAGMRRDAMRQRESEFSRNQTADLAKAGADNQLRQRSLELQQYGLTQEAALARARMEQERSTDQARMELERQGMTEENAYRYATLSQDGQFRQRALELQAAGMNMDEAFRTAELEYRERDSGEQRRGEQDYRDKMLAVEILKMMKDPTKPLNVSELPDWLRQYA